MTSFLPRNWFTRLSNQFFLCCFLMASISTASGQGFSLQGGEGSPNPLSNVNPGPGGSSPSLVDLDGDGDLDLVITTFNGTILYYINTGTTQPNYVPAPSPIPPPANVSNNNLKFSFGDLDGDNDLDAITGNSDGLLITVINNGTRTNPLFPQSFTRPTTTFSSSPQKGARVTAANPFGNLNYSDEGYTYVSLADFDSDGDLDALVITRVAIHYLRNVGSPTAPVYVEITGCDNPFDGIVRSGSYSNPIVGDMDRDGDLDVALSGTPILYYRNIGTRTAPRFVQIIGEGNPFNGYNLGDSNQLGIGDLDKDGDPDIVSGSTSESLLYLKNILQITRQPSPASQVSCAGSNVSTSIEATGDASVSYQWYRNSQSTDTPLEGQNQPTLTLYNVQPEDAGLYYVQITGGSGGSLFSDAFNLVVQKAVITRQPASASTVSAGTDVEVSASVSGPITSYQWLRNGQPVEGQNSAVLTLNGVTQSQAGSYVLVAVSSCNSVTSNAFTLTINCPSAPTLQASAQTTSNQPISVTASGCSEGTINWNPQGGAGTANGSIYTFTQPGSYTLTATCTLNGCTSPPSAPLPLVIQMGTLSITSVSTLRCELFDQVKGGYYVTFAPQYNGQNSTPISFSVVNEKLVTTDPAPYTIRLYTDNPAITLVASQAGSTVANFRYEWWAACQAGTPANQPPTTTGIANQTLVQRQSYELQLTNYFTDPEGQPLTFSAQGLPAGLTLSGSVIGGVPTNTGISSVSVTAKDAVNQSVSTTFQITVNSPTETPAGFAITGVSTISCEPLTANSRRVTFTPLYAGTTGSPISFSVVAEKSPTTDPGPYTLDLYQDNPAITLSAKQGNEIARYVYDWLSACTATARIGAIETGKGLQVRVLGNPVEGKAAEIEISGAAGQSVQLLLVDQQGRVLMQNRINKAAQTERLSVPMGPGKGTLFLQVSTPTQRQQVKLLKQ